MGRLRVRTNGTRSLGSKVSLERSVVRLEELFVRKGFWELWVLHASQGSIRRDCCHAVRFPLPSRNSPLPNPYSHHPRPNLTNPLRATFFLNLLLGIWSLIPTAAQRAASKIGIDDMQTKHSPLSDNSDREWEMKRVLPTHATPATPYTPRTLAFNTLDRQLPLRAQEGKGRWN